MAGVCDQDTDTYAQTKAPSIADLLAFTQEDSTELRGYHFFNYPYSRIGNLGCPSIESFCSHIMISYDAGMFSSIVSRVRQLRTSPQQLIYGVSLNSIGQNSATITWKTSSTAAGGVVYSADPDASTGSTEVPEAAGGTTTHSAAISSLVANTRYYFRIRARIPGSANSEYSSIGFFQTSQANAPILKASNPSLTRNPNGTYLR